MKLELLKRVHDGKDMHEVGDIIELGNKADAKHYIDTGMAIELKENKRATARKTKEEKTAKKTK